MHFPGQSLGFSTIFASNASEDADFKAEISLHTRLSWMWFKFSRVRQSFQFNSFYLSIWICVDCCAMYETLHLLKLHLGGETLYCNFFRGSTLLLAYPRGEVVQRACMHRQRYVHHPTTQPHASEWVRWAAHAALRSSLPNPSPCQEDEAWE